MFPRASQEVIGLSVNPTGGTHLVAVYRALIPYRTEEGDNAQVHFSSIQVEADDEAQARSLAIEEFNRSAELHVAGGTPVIGAGEFHISLAPFAHSEVFDMEVVEHDATTRVFKLHGFLSAAGSEKLKETFDAAKANGVTVVVLDLSGLANINSIGLATLVAAAAMFDARLAAVPARISRLLKMIGAEMVFPYFMGADEAAHAKPR
jgi:anti-anti-sigma regulatory factor